MIDVQFTYVFVLALVCGGMLAVLFALRSALARRGSGRLAQLRFRRVHGPRVVELLGGRLDPRQGSPWIDTMLGGRAVQLVAAPVDGRMQAGVQLLAHDIGVNVWHTTGGRDELEAPEGVDLDSLAAIVDALRAAEVDSVACGVPIDSDPRPPHLVRMRFDSVEELPARFDRIAPLLEQLERASGD